MGLLRRNKVNFHKMTNICIFGAHEKHNDLPLHLIFLSILTILFFLVPYQLVKPGGNAHDLASDSNSGHFSFHSQPAILPKFPLSLPCRASQERGRKAAAGHFYPMAEFHTNTQIFYFLSQLLIATSSWVVSGVVSLSICPKPVEALFVHSLPSISCCRDAISHPACGREKKQFVRNCFDQMPLGVTNKA